MLNDKASLIQLSWEDGHGHDELSLARRVYEENLKYLDIVHELEDAFEYGLWYMFFNYGQSLPGSVDRWSHWDIRGHTSQLAVIVWNESLEATAS